MIIALNYASAWQRLPANNVIISDNADYDYPYLTMTLPYVGIAGKEKVPIAYFMFRFLRRESAVTKDRFADLFEKVYRI